MPSLLTRRTFNLSKSNFSAGDSTGRAESGEEGKEEAGGERKRGKAGGKEEKK